MKIIDAWEEEDGAGASYEVNVDDGFINASQGSSSFGQDVLSALSPHDARKLASALCIAADEAEKHRRWHPSYEGKILA